MRIPALQKVRAEKGRRKLSEYVRQAWHTIEPSTHYLHNWHIDAICEHLQAVTEGKILRLLINIPPRYMKSILVSVMWPTWEWIDAPWSRWIFTSYASSLSLKHSVDRRTVVQSDWYQAHYGHRFEITEAGKEELHNDKRGVFIATSTGSSVTGKGGTRLVCDDLHNPTQAMSDVQRQAGIDYYKRTLATRLDDKNKGAIVVVMQRLHEQDIAAEVKELGFEHLNIPGECEELTVYSLPISGRKITYKPGDILWAARENREQLAAQKKTLGSYAYAGQYMQRPTPAEGGLFKRHWWQYYREAPRKFQRIIQSWDMAFKDTDESSYVVGQVWGEIDADCYLLDQVRDRMSFTASLAAVRLMTAKWPEARAKLVEDKANGPAIINTLRREISGLIAVEPEGGKEARAQAISPQVESGNVYLPEDAPWVNDFVQEFANVPKSNFWDQVDACSQALIWLAKAFKVPGLAPSSGLTGKSKWK